MHLTPCQTVEVHTHAAQAFYDAALGKGGELSAGIDAPTLEESQELGIGRRMMCEEGRDRKSGELILFLFGRERDRRLVMGQQERAIRIRSHGELEGNLGSFSGLPDCCHDLRRGAE
jgi:hypothetical protein